MTFAEKAREEWKYIREDDDHYIKTVSGKTVFFVNEQDSEEDQYLSEFFEHIVKNHNEVRA